MPDCRSPVSALPTGWKRSRFSRCAFSPSERPNWWNCGVRWPEAPILLRRRSGHLPRAAAENDGIDVADHATLHDLVLLDCDMPDAGNVRHVHVLKRAVQLLGGCDRLSIAIGDVVVDIAPHTPRQAGAIHRVQANRELHRSAEPIEALDHIR